LFDAVKYTVKMPMIIDIIIKRIIAMVIMKARCFELKMFIRELENVD
jgi:hypothetical protein